MRGFFDIGLSSPGLVDATAAWLKSENRALGWALCDIGAAVTPPLVAGAMGQEQGRSSRESLASAGSSDRIGSVRHSLNEIVRRFYEVDAVCSHFLCFTQRRLWF